MTSDPATCIEKGSEGRYPRLWNVRKVWRRGELMNLRGVAVKAQICWTF